MLYNECLLILLGSYGGDGYARGGGVNSTFRNSFDSYKACYSAKIYKQVKNKSKNQTNRDEALLRGLTISQIPTA